MQKKFFKFILSILLLIHMLEYTVNYYIEKRQTIFLESFAICLLEKTVRDITFQLWVLQAIN